MAGSQWLEALGVELPIIQAPMAGSTTVDLVVAVAEAGGLGSLPTATLGLDAVRSEWRAIRARTAKPVAVNYFCHARPVDDAARDVAWRAVLAPYYAEHGIDPSTLPSGAARHPFDEAACAFVEEARPEVVSFHFGVPADPLLARVRATGAVVMASATSAEEARWLEPRCDVIIAQGVEAGGHQGHFLTQRPPGIPLASLLPAVVASVSRPVVAAGGLMNGADVAAVLAQGASAAQLGTAFLFCPEAGTSALHRAALVGSRGEETALTTLFTGRPARGIVNRIMRELGPLREDAPAFPLGANYLAPLRAAAERAGRVDFTPLWAGTRYAEGRVMPAAELVRRLADEAGLAPAS
ncbi:nitronate monooxygenase family protein [uncultured Alsobacter sp.]|uniref:NAD(P)H-dependent flavin oxidoreductase n=1 Tax=uncultured Alsobacter sp. TaxID=1748258 RepID=UPI0025E2E6EC|nr:nitronate monooxygenase [uncultured Alsobacter sp.]